MGSVMRTRWLVVPAMALTLSGCSAVTEVAEQSAGVLSVATDVAAACTTAAAAWAPGVSPQDARQAIDEAITALDATLANAPAIPGVDAVQSALDTAQQTLAADPTSTSLGVSQKTLELACSAFLIVN